MLVIKILCVNKTHYHVNAKEKYMKFALITLLVSLLSFNAGADQYEKQSTQKTIQAPSTSTIKVPTQDNIQTSQLSEAEMYKLLYENSSSANDKIVSTMHWAIGLVSTFILAIFGSQILFNYRINKEEIEAIKSDIDERFISLKSDLMESMHSTTRDNEKNIRSEFKQISVENAETITEKHKDLEKYLDAKFESSAKDISRLKEVTDEETTNIKVELEKLSGYVWELKGVKSIALTRYIKTALMEIDLGRESKYTLDHVIEILNDSLDIYKDDLDRLKKLMDVIPEKNSKLKKEIERLSKEKRVYIFVDDPDSPGRLIPEYI